VVAMKGDGMLPLSIAQARASLAPEKRTPMSVGREPGERVFFAWQETGSTTVKWNQTR
jgi:hypothetical protein